MYSRSQLWKALDSPNLFFREVNRLYHRRAYRRTFNTEGTAIMEEDWDNLLLLDACRFDLFKSEHNFAGILESRESRGSNTVEYLYGNFHQGEFCDTVYITANPQFHRNREYIKATFHAEVNVWEDNWDKSTGTVLPEQVTDEALKAVKEYPNKRLLIHYVQPHYPFIGSNHMFDEGDRFLNPDHEDGWYQIMTGDLKIDREVVWEAYEENFNQTLPHVQKLVEDLPGKTVITSDHGNMIGDRAHPVPIKEWGHPRGIYTPELVEVPWFIIEDDTRKSISADPPLERTKETVNEQEIKQRLENLGYR